MAASTGTLAAYDYTPYVPLWQSSRDFVELKDFRRPTKKEYVRYLRKLAEHYRCDPATLTEDQLRAYFLFLRQEKKFGGSAMKLARCALRAFFRDCLHVAGWTVFEEVRIAPPQTLPLVLSRDRWRRCSGGAIPRYRAVLGLIYHTGLRVGEAVRIERRDFRDTATAPVSLMSRGQMDSDASSDGCSAERGIESKLRRLGFGPPPGPPGVNAGGE